MTSDLQLWRSENSERWFLVPRDAEPIEGDYPIRAVGGESACVSQAWASTYEVSEDEGLAWVRDELGETLDELKLGVDEKLADLHRNLDEANRTPVADDTHITPDAVPGLFALLKQLPRVIIDSLSGDTARVDMASESLAALQQRLKDAGIDLDERFSNFPDRLAGLREDFAKRGTAENSSRKDPPVEDR
jgi:hypothetical protein